MSLCFKRCPWRRNWSKDTGWRYLVDAESYWTAIWCGQKCGFKTPEKHIRKRWIGWKSNLCKICTSCWLMGRKRINISFIRLYCVKTICPLLLIWFPEWSQESGKYQPSGLSLTPLNPNWLKVNGIHHERYWHAIMILRIIPWALLSAKLW